MSNAKNQKGKAEEQFLIDVPLPIQTKSYTVISHGEIIQKIENELNIEGLVIESRDYSYSYNGEIVLAKLFLTDKRDPDLGICFTWVNSYNKQVKFGCGIGGLILDNNAVMLGSEGTSWIRMHTGLADKEAYDIIEQLVQNINLLFDKLITEKEKMKTLPVDDEMFGRIMGSLFFEQSLLTPTQANAVKKEWYKKEETYSDKNTLWGLYKMLMYGIEMGDIKLWITCQQKLHHMIMTEYVLAEDDSTDKLGLIAKATVEVENLQEWADKELAKENDGSEDVGPPEMYIGDEVTQQPASQQRLESVNASNLDEDEESEEILKAKSDFLNVAVKLGYKEEACDIFLESLYNASSANSINLKNFRTWVDEGGNDDTPTEDVTHNPDINPTEDKEQFIVFGREVGYSIEILDFYLEEHYNTDLTLDDNCKSFSDWAPKPTKPVEKEVVVPTGKELVIEQEIVGDIIEDAEIIEEEEEEVVEEQELIEEELVEEDEVTPTISEDELLEQMSDSPEMKIEISEMTDIVDGDTTFIKQTMDSLFEQEEDVSDNTEVQGLFNTPDNLDDKVEIILPKASEKEVVVETVPVEEAPEVIEEPVVKKAPELLKEVIEESVKAVDTEDEQEDEDPFALQEEEEEEEEDLFDIQSENLEPSKDLLDISVEIEKQMLNLYGEVRAYHHEQVDGYINVIIDDTLERFAIAS